MPDFASTTLHLQEGTSDKVYQVTLCTSVVGGKGKYDVTAKWGRRGQVMMSQKKLTCVSLDTAMDKMQELLAAKRKKGYKDLDLTKEE